MNTKSLFASLAASAVLVLGLGRAEAAQGENPSGPNLVEVAIAANTSGPLAGSFDTLIAAVQAADPAILQVLTAGGKRTVFAPTDQAFAALGLDETNIASLPQSQLTTILAYHVSPGQRLAEKVVKAHRIRMLAGGSVSKERGSTILFDNLGRPANILVTDVMASNGVIHVIDSVLLPAAP